MNDPGSGASLFLLHQLYTSEEHQLGWDKYAYDNEYIHHVLLKLFSEHSTAFAQKLLGVPTIRSLKTAIEPERGLFDLLFVIDGESLYCEVKVWADLTKTQFDRQNGFLSESAAKGLYVLFTKAADEWPQDRVSSESRGCSRVIGLLDVVSALRTLEETSEGAVRELAVAYRTSLEHLNSRY